MFQRCIETTFGKGAKSVDVSVIYVNSLGFLPVSSNNNNVQ